VAAPPQPGGKDPGGSFDFPERPTAVGAPLVYEHSREAGPDETFFLVGENLTKDVIAWGQSANSVTGQEWRPRVQFQTGSYLAATLPEDAPDGPFVIWVRNDKGYSPPIVLNRPEPWWCREVREEGHYLNHTHGVEVYGRNLARRPDFIHSFALLSQPGKPGVWLEQGSLRLAGQRLSVWFDLPSELASGNYELRLHAGVGGQWGWSQPVTLRIPAVKTVSAQQVTLNPGVAGAELQEALNEAGSKPGGGVVHLPMGVVVVRGTLVIPEGVELRGFDRHNTVLQTLADPKARFAGLADSGWHQGPGRIHTPGDTMTYAIEVATSGTYAVWMRYGTDMKPWNQPGVSGNHTLAVDQAQSVPLLNLENTGGWGPETWSKAATLRVPAGRHTLTWKNVKGGGISLDAFVFAQDPSYRPTMSPPPRTGNGLIVLQAEDCQTFETKEGELPGGVRAAVWLSGDGAALSNLSVLGSPQTNIGIAIQSKTPLDWVSGCQVSNVRVADIDGKQSENCAVRLRNVDRATVSDSELYGRAPLFLFGARRSLFKDNRLVSVTRFGGNAEAAILGRTGPIEECVIEGNRIASPPGAAAGGPTARRLLWFSTGHGSISHNYIANNGIEKPSNPDTPPAAGHARFGGVAGTDQNVGEMILFEGNHRTMYFGPLASADANSVTVPRTLPDTPAERLGSVERKQLAHDSAGHETPFWPPDADDGSEEPPIGEYYVTIFSGRGQGQTRRVVRRQGPTLRVDRPWTVSPQAGSVAAIGTMFYQNLIVNNETTDGMTGIQLWISCVENVIASNTIARQRRPGLFLYANGTTLASSMPRTWNRGISPLFWNVAEGNRTDECSAGVLVTSGDEGPLPIEFPRALGNVLRHNSFFKNRTDGVILTSRPTPAGMGDTSASVVGTIVEFNVVRDAQTAYHAGSSSDATVFRRNHAYFWYPVNNSGQKPVAFQVDAPKTTVALEQNAIEGIQGVPDDSLIELKTASGDGRLP
jgi:hypothetical protein